MRVQYNIILFYICLNIACMILNSLNFTATKVSYVKIDVLGQAFTFDAAWLSFEAAVGFAGVIGLLLRNPFLGMVGFIIFFAGIIFKPVSQIFTAFPNFVANFVPSEISIGISTILTFLFFFFMIELLMGRNMGEE